MHNFRAKRHEWWQPKWIQGSLRSFYVGAVLRIRQRNDLSREPLRTVTGSDSHHRVITNTEHVSRLLRFVCCLFRKGASFVSENIIHKRDFCQHVVDSCVPWVHSYIHSFIHSFIAIWAATTNPSAQQPTQWHKLLGVYKAHVFG
jgi:hypothetical protein